MRCLRIPVVCLLVIVDSCLLAAQVTPQRASIIGTAPVFVRPDANLGPLRLASEGSIVNVLATEGDWYRIEFQDPQFGRRVGYIRKAQARLLPTATEQRPLDLTVPEAKSERPTQSTQGQAPRGRTPQGGRIAVFISAPTTSGFVDASKDILDSVKDLRSRIAKAKEFTLVDRREAATIVLTVLDRGVGAEAYGQRIHYSDYLGPEVTTTPMVAETYWIATRVDVGDYHRGIVGTLTRESFAWSGGAWSYCADQVVKDLRSWAQANAEVLAGRRR